MPTIGLSMIVKNEEKLILRCLESVRPLVDFICISDTGSTDKTLQLIHDFLAEHEMLGFTRSTEWKDFSTNRNLALRELNQHWAVDYAFMIDADDQLEVAADFDIAAWKAGMDKDVYDVPVRHGGIVHARPQIFRNHPDFYWRGVLHEFLDVKRHFTRDMVRGLTVNASIEGSRNLDPLKFHKDAVVLEQAIAEEKDEYLRTRYQFYLAQSYRDSNQIEKARAAYVKRAEMGGWDQEVYVSLNEAIRCHTRLGRDLTAPMEYFELAAKILPGRAEAAHSLAFFCRQLGKNKEGMDAAATGLDKPMPDGLFVEPWIYDYALRDEYAVNAYWADQHLECLKHSLLLLANPKTPPNEHKRIADNALIALDKLTQKFVSNTSLVFSD